MAGVTTRILCSVLVDAQRAAGPEGRVCHGWNLNRISAHLSGDEVLAQAFEFGAAIYSYRPHCDVTPEMMTHRASISNEIVLSHYPSLQAGHPGTNCMRRVCAATQA